MDKLVKVINSMKLYYGGGENIELTKKDVIPMPMKRERQENCKAMVECILSSQVKSNAEYSILLGVTLETLLQTCHDDEVDVRLAAEESLNRIIKGSNEMMFGKVLLEFYKEIKKNGSSRSLRASLIRFSNLVHKIRPSKCRPYIVSLLPAMIRISQRDEEVIQECLASSVSKIFPCLGSFAGDQELLNFRNELRKNLSSDSATFRRTAATCIFEITKHSRNRSSMLYDAIESILENMTAMAHDKYNTLGNLTALRHLLPLIAENANFRNNGHMADSFGTNQDNVKTQVSDKQVIKLFEACVHFLFHSDTNVITATLETFQILLKLPSTFLMNFISSTVLVKTEFSQRLINCCKADFKGKKNDNEEMMEDVKCLLDEIISNVDDSLSKASRPLNNSSSEQINVLPSESEANGIGSDTNISGQPNQGKYMNKASHIYDSVSPILVVANILCEKFLRIKTGMSTRDDVRISVKNLALTCLGHIIRLQPRIMLSSVPVIDDNDCPTSMQLQEVLTYQNHFDPHLRGCVVATAANFIRSSLIESKDDFNGWMSSQSGNGITIECLVSIICTGLCGDSSVTTRASISAVGLCIKQLLGSVYVCHALKLLSCILNLQNTTYWLVKVDMFTLFSGINFPQLLYMAESSNGIAQWQSYKEANSLRQNIISVGMKDLAHSDIRVRNAAGNMLVCSVSNMAVAVDSCLCDMVTSESASVCNKMLHVSTRTSTANVAPQTREAKTLLKVYRGYEHERIDENSSVAHNLSVMVGKITSLLSLSTSKQLTQGCVQVLLLLTKKYPVSEYPSAYGCDSMKISQYADEPSKMPKQMEQHFGIIPIISSMLNSGSMLSDLAAQTDVLLLAGNYLAGCSLHGFYTIGPNPKIGDQESLLLNKGASVSEERSRTWSSILDRSLAIFAVKLFTHILRLISIFHHVIGDIIPSLQSKSVLPSLSTPPSISSPLKKKDKLEQKDNVHATEQTMHKKSSSVTLDDFEKENTGKTASILPFNFAHSREYMKVYELLLGAYDSYKTTVENDSNERFCMFLRTVLDVFCQIMEIATFSDVERYTEEILLELRSTFVIEPTLTVQAVQQLLKGLFGTNLVSQIELDEHTKSKSNIVNTHSKEPQLYKSSFYHQVFHHPLNDLTMAIANASFHHYLQSETSQKAGSGWFGSIKKKVEKKLSMTAKRAKGDKTSIQNYIRLFESIVIKSLKNYTITSSVTFQKHVLNLLAQLVQLRVNYCLLDSDQIFIGFIIKQFETIEAGLIKESESLIPHIFFFLVLLSYEKHHSKSVMTISKIIQLCDGIMASSCDASTHAIPALQPIVHDLFLLRGNLKADSDLDTQREVVQSMLFRIIHYPEVLLMLTTILQYYRKENTEQWKKSSRQVTDILLPMLTHLKLNISKPSDISNLHNLFEALSPSALRPIDLLLNIFFLLPSNLGTLTLHQRWIMKTLSLLRVLLCHSNEDYILLRIKEMQIKPELFSCQHLLSLLNVKENKKDVGVTANSNDNNFPPDEVLSRTFIQLIGFTVERLLTEIFDPVKPNEQDDSMELLAQLLSEFLLTVTYMCRCGSFKQLTSITNVILRRVDQSKMFYSGSDLCNSFYLLTQHFPVLVLLWSQLLTCVGYVDITVWAKLTGAKIGSEELDTDNLVLNREIVHRGSIIMLADYISQNQSETELMTWLIQNHTSEIINLRSEPPMQDFISAIHHNSDASRLFVEYIKTVCSANENVKPSFKKNILYCLRGIHSDQSYLLLVLLLDDMFLFSPLPALSEFSHRIACERVEIMLTTAYDDENGRVIVNYLQANKKLFDRCKLSNRFSRVSRLIERLLSLLTTKIDQHSSPIQQLPVVLCEPNKEWYKNSAKLFHEQTSKSQEVAKVLSVLDYNDIMEIMKGESFTFTHINECISYGISEISCPQNAIRPYPEDITSTLLKASLVILVSKLDSLIQDLPSFKFGIENNANQCSFELDQENSSVSKYWKEIFHMFGNRDKRELVFLICKTLTRCFIYQQFIGQPFEILDKRNEKFVRLLVLCHEMILCCVHHQVPSSAENHLICLEYMNQCLQKPEIQKHFYGQDNLFWVLTVCNSQLMLIALYTKEAQQKNLPETSNSSSIFSSIMGHNSIPSMICKRACKVMEKFYEGNIHNIPAILVKPFRMSFIQILSHPFFNSMARVPALLLKSDMKAEELASISQEKSGEYLQDKGILKEFVNRINTLGWISRMQFEETWTSLLGVLVSHPIGDSSQNASPMDDEAVSISCLTIRALTALVVNSCMKPQGGQPGTGAFQTIPRAPATKSLHTKIGRDLLSVLCIVEKELMEVQFGDQMNEIHEYYQISSNSLQMSENETMTRDVLRSCLQQNIERRDRSRLYYGLGQRSVQSFRTLYDIMPVDEDTNEISSDEENSGDFSSGEDFNSEVSDITEKVDKLHVKNIPSPVKLEHQRVDAHSCVQFLIDLFSEWFISASTVSLSNTPTGGVPVYTLKLPRQFLCECLHSLLLISDFFIERQQFEWMFSSLNSLQIVQTSEDDVMLQYLVLGMCKAGSILGMSKKICEILAPMLEAALGSSLISCQTFGLQGILYILESESKDCLKPLINLSSRFVCEKYKNIAAGTILHSQQLLRNVIAVGFSLIERWSTFVTSSQSTILVQGAISLLSSGQNIAISDELYYMLIKSLEVLVTSYSLSTTDCDAVAKLATDQFSSNKSLFRVLTALNIILACMYHGIMREGEPNSSAKAVTSEEDAMEARLLSMERITLLFDKIRIGLPQEGRILIQLLPRLLDSFFSTQDRMNKVIGEFVSSLHPFPNLIATVLHEVFQTLHSRGESSLVCEWVMLSLGNFTQRTPISTAVWCLTCVFVSASTNPWINSTLPIILSEMNSMQKIEVNQTFYIAAHDFYVNQVTEELDRRSFHSIFKAVSVAGSPYQKLLDIIDNITVKI